MASAIEAIRKKSHAATAGPSVGDVFESSFFTWCYTF